MLPDPALQGYLKEDLTYSDNKALAKAWQKYTQRKHPTSREQEEIQQGQDLNVNITTFQFSVFFSKLGHLLRRPGLGKRNLMW